MIAIQTRGKHYQGQVKKKQIVTNQPRNSEIRHRPPPNASINRVTRRFIAPSCLLVHSNEKFYESHAFKDHSTIHHIFDKTHRSTSEIIDRAKKAFPLIHENELWPNIVNSPRNNFRR